MENEVKTSEARKRIKTALSVEDAEDLQSFSKRNPVYGVSVRILETNKEQDVASIELLFAHRTKQRENQTLVHFFLAYAKEVYFKINQKLI